MYNKDPNSIRLNITIIDNYNGATSVLLVVGCGGRFVRFVSKLRGPVAAACGGLGAQAVSM